MAGKLDQPTNSDEWFEWIARRLRYLEGAAIPEGVPVGCVIYTGRDPAVDDPPGNFLWAHDGHMEDPTYYDELFAEIGTTYGGDGVTTFGMPAFPLVNGMRAIIRF